MKSLAQFVVEFGGHIARINDAAKKYDDVILRESYPTNVWCGGEVVKCFTCHIRYAYGPYITVYVTDNNEWAIPG